MLLTLPVADVLCIYGIPDSEKLSELEFWLEEDSKRFLVVLEDDELALFNRFFDHNRVRLCYGENEEALKKVAWEFVFLHFEYLDIPGNPSKNPEKMQEHFAKMAFFQQGIHLLASDFQNKGIDLLENFLRNEPVLTNAKKGQALFGKFSKIPAIICGAGPSLEKEVSILKKLKDQALMFAGGTALSSLAAFGIEPHIGGVIDPHPPSNRLFQHQAFQIPVFFQTRAHPQTIQQMQGPLLWMPGNFANFLENESFDSGWNVSTFLVAIACHLGCDPIILVGVDLAQTKSKKYAGNLENNDENRLVSVEKNLSSQTDWIFAGEWLEEFAKKHPETHWINASNGLTIAGFEKRELGKIFFEKQIDLSGNLHSEIVEMKEKMIPFLQGKDLKSSLANIHLLIEKILQLLEELFPNSPKKNGEYALLELEIEKEIAYTKFLFPIWEIWQHIFLRQIPENVPEGYRIELNQWLFMKGICDEARQL